ncbi:MAG: hypothetical protein QXT68_03765 [Halobacteria archaeon]
MSGADAVLEKALSAVERELSREEYLEFLQLLAPKLGDATRELQAIRRRITDAEFRKALRRKGVSL